MKRVLHLFLLLLFTAGVALPVTAAPAIVLAPPSIVQRVVITDFLLLETNNDVALAPTNLLVIYFPDFEQPGTIERAVALHRTSAGKCVVTYLAAALPRARGHFKSEEKEIEPVIARNVLAVFRHLLETNVHPSSEALYQPSKNDDAWILLRDRQVALAGVTLNNALQAMRTEEVAIYRDLCAGLVGMFVAPAAERDDALAQLDRFAAAYVESKQLSRR